MTPTKAPNNGASTSHILQINPNIVAITQERIAIEYFWHAILVYHDRPHLVNTRLIAVEPLLLTEIVIENSETFKEFSEHLKNKLKEHNLLFDTNRNLFEFIKQILRSLDENAIVSETNWDEFKNSINGIFLSIRTLIGRNVFNKCLEIVILDKKNGRTNFIPIHTDGQSLIAPSCSYSLELVRDDDGILESKGIRATTNSINKADQDFISKLFKKFLKWTKTEPTTNIIPSLGCVNIEEYYCLYHQLKLKYGFFLIKEWPKKANTDAQKFVHEDLHICTYLISIWNNTPKENINFVDCGCGNGLLVYILNSEGYKGFGIDIRRRDLWDLFPNADLRIGTVTDKSIFSECNWIIGNHSDELTPWIPVIALKSSPQTNYFVLPCCSYDFSGAKYERMNSKLSTYNDYLLYIKDISLRCQFETFIDKLRIPSTKRTCLMGFRKDFSLNFEEIKRNVEQFVRSRMQAEFRPKNPEEKVRNATHLPKELIRKIVETTIKKLLEIDPLYERNYKDQLWNRGGTLHLKEIVNLFSDDDLRLLKSECGGLQTVLKNHRYLFEVKEGNVRLRLPPRKQDVTKCYKDKPCWFFLNHPNGCKHEGGDCAYKH